MRVAALYDIHGNLPALRAVIADLARERVDAVVVGGDVASGPLPRQTIERLMALGPTARFVRGNADREVVDAYDSAGPPADAADDSALGAARFAAGRLSDRERTFLDSFEPTVVLDIDGLGQTVFCHGSPRSDTEIITPVTSDARLREILAGEPRDVIVCGHTHRQFDRTVDRWRVVNAGSVGMPYEGRAGAFWALLGPDVELRRTPYDLDRAVRELSSEGFPSLDDALRESLLGPMDADEVSRFFEGQATADRR